MSIMSDIECDRSTDGSRPLLAQSDPSPGASAYLLNQRTELEHIARAAADRAVRAGVGDVIASASETGGVVLRARGGLFDSAVREGAQSLSIKVFEHGRTGTAITSAFNREAVDLAVDRAIAIAREVEPDSETAMPAPEWLARNAPEIPLFDPWRISPQELGRNALEIEAAVQTSGDATLRVSEAGVSTMDACSAIAIGRDFDRSIVASRHDSWCVALAERDGLMASDWWSSSDRRAAHLLSPVELGAIVAERAVRKLGGRTLDSRSCPILLDAVVAPSIVLELSSALSGQAQFNKATFLAEGKGAQALAAHVDLIEDPFEPFGLASGACDSEGVGGEARHIIRSGVVEDFFLSCLHARKLGLKPTGNADGVRNLRLDSREPAAPLSALLRTMGRGLWVTDLIGGAVDPVSGTYSKAAAGFWVEDGEVAFPVQDITIAGELPQMLKQIVAVGSDVYRRGAVRSGSLLIESMRVSGR